MVAVTPRSNIPGAIPSALTVKTGGKLRHHKSSKRSYGLLSYKRFYFFTSILVPLLVVTGWLAKINAFTLTVKSKVTGSIETIAVLPIVFQILALGSVLLTTYVLVTSGKPYLLFAYNCFLKPFLMRKPDGIDSDSHQKRLEQFYEGQADVYDVTRKRLLRGRNTMLRLAAAQLRQHYQCHFANDFQV
ncbi:hypothetical protein HK102_003274, partial [Quaeritorhiza haematococci]